MILKLSLDLPDDEAYIALTRQFGRGLLEYLSVVADDISDVETIVTELVTNVIRHAQSSKGRFQVILEYHADNVIITVIDSGHGFAFRDVPAIGTSRPRLRRRRTARRLRPSPHRTRVRPPAILPDRSVGNDRQSRENSAVYDTGGSRLCGRHEPHRRRRSQRQRQMMPFQ